MQSDADRFRPRDHRGVTEHAQPSNVASEAAPSAFGASYGESAPQQEPGWQQEPPQPAPRYEQPLQPAPLAQPADPPPASLPTPYGVPRYAPPHFAAHLDERGAPLIHPAAAQVSNLTPYGVPVYQAPAYAYAPQPHRGLSITALVLGLCSFIFAWTLVVVPIIGVVFGFLALRREPAGRTMAIIGLVGSMLGLLWVLLFYLLPLLAFLGVLVLSAPSM